MRYCNMKTRHQCIRAAIESLRREINALRRAEGRAAGGVRVVAAAKTFPAADVLAAAAGGVADIGENYLQEAEAKMRECAAAAVRWHFIGRLQSRKAAAVARAFDSVHSVDSAALAAKLSAARAGAGSPLEVFMQINIDNEHGKGGMPAAQAAAAAREIAAMPNLKLTGLMCIPNPAGDARAAFRALRELRDDINRREEGIELTSLSMGMSGDYKEAIAEGATHLRLGTAVFGARDYGAEK